VVRAVLVSLVLSLAVGQSAAVVCKVWCHEATPAGCPHQDRATSATVRAGDNCRTIVAEAVVLVREDGRRTAPAPNVHDALAPRWRFVPPSNDWGPGAAPGQPLLLAARPLVSLRI
jgi:hypothetical protein